MKGVRHQPQVLGCTKVKAEERVRLNSLATATVSPDLSLPSDLALCKILSLMQRLLTSSRHDELSLRIIHNPDALFLAREWLRVVRERQGLRQVDVATRLALLGPQAALTRVQLSRLERGNLNFASLESSQLEGLRQVLNISQPEWEERMRLISMPLQRRDHL